MQPYTEDVLMLYVYSVFNLYTVFHFSSVFFYRLNDKLELEKRPIF